jgi:hypothetical protein
LAFSKNSNQGAWLAGATLWPVPADSGARADRTDASDAAARYANKRAAPARAGLTRRRDAPALTVAYPVAKRDWAEEAASLRRRQARGPHE